MDKTEQHYLIYGGAGLLLFMLVMVLMSRGNGQQSGTIPAPSKTILDFIQQNTAESDNAAQARSALAASSLLQYKQDTINLELGLAGIKANTDINLQNAKTAEDIANIQANAATQTAQLTADAAKYIGYEQSQAQQYQSYTNAYSAYANGNAQAKVSENQKSASIVASIMGFLGNVASIFVPAKKA